jgi:hypothetical protein
MIQRSVSVNVAASDVERVIQAVPDAPQSSYVLANAKYAAD